MTPTPRVGKLAARLDRMRGWTIAALELLLRFQEDCHCNKPKANPPCRNCGATFDLFARIEADLDTPTASASPAKGTTGT